MPEQTIGIAGIGCSVPSTVLTNDDLEKLVDTSDEWIRTRTGIQTRHVLAKDETLLDLAVEASRRALEDAGVTAEEITDIRVGVNSWFRFPSLATRLQEVLGALGSSASDVSAGCSGFIYGMEDAYNKLLIQKLQYHRDGVALVVGAEALSHITDWSDRNTCVLFGDGAGAVVLKATDRGAILATHTHADGRYGPMLYSDPVNGSQRGDNGEWFVRRESNWPFLHMQGRKVYPVAVETMVREVRAVIDKYNHAADEQIGIEDIGYIYPHQANLRIIESVAKRLKAPLDRVYTNGVVRYGNTSTASIPLGYCDNRDHFAGGGSTPRLEIDVAFGSGFASGAILRRVG